MPSTTCNVDTDKLSSLEWSFLPPMQTQREGGAAVAVGKEMVAIMGGYHVRDKFLKSCLCFKNGEWKQLPEMTHARMGCGACSVGSRIIVAGGFQRGRTYLNSCEMLDTTTLTWQQLPSMRNSRAGCAAVGLPPGEFGGNSGVVIVCGGWKDADTAVDTVEQLDLASGQWSLLPSMLTSRAGCAAVVVDNNKIVVTGGYSNYGYCLSTAEVFDVSTQTWSSLPSMKERRDASASCVVGKCVMVVGGGESSTSPSKTCEVLNMDKLGDGWMAFPDLKSPRFGCAAAAMGNQILVLGGRGPEGQHLECVESVTLPLLDKQKAKQPLRERPKSDLGTRSDQAFAAADPPLSIPSSEEWKKMVDSTLKMANHMIAKDKARTNETYERNKTHEMDECGRKVKEVDKKLKTLQLEKHRLERVKQKALQRRDERLLEIEEQRRQSLAQIERHFRPLITRAANSSAPEYFIDDGKSVNPSISASDLALQIKDDEPDSPPEELICCITGVLMKDPVTAVDGHTYEREAIEIWFNRFKTGKPTSPMTNEKLNSRRLIPSYNIRSQCQTWLNRSESFSSDFGAGTEMSTEVQSCAESRRSSAPSRHRSSSSSAAMRSHHHHHALYRSDSSLLGRSSSASRAGRSTTLRSTSRSRTTGRLDTEPPPSPLGRSFTLFSRRSNASGMASTRRPSH